ncbi:MAG: GNAT family N-acetyltransferase, partial [Anaerolineales bacterium]|nr:GNAT family N-acetyltransferase [Anaerolineales bacterium]
MTRVELISAATDELLDALARLIPQLKISSPRLTRDVLTALVSSDASTLLAARDDSGQIVGALTLVVYRAPT